MKLQEDVNFQNKYHCFSVNLPQLNIYTLKAVVSHFSRLTSRNISCA